MKYIGIRDTVGTMQSVQVMGFFKKCKFELKELYCNLCKSMFLNKGYRFIGQALGWYIDSRPNTIVKFQKIIAVIYQFFNWKIAILVLNKTLLQN